MLYNQLGITEAVLNGSADEQTMINYYNNTIEPILSAISLEMQRKFLTQNARTRGQAIRFYRDAFKLVPVKVLAELADKFTRNEIATSNELRSVIGWKPVDDPKADMLINSNLNHTEGEMGLEGMGALPGMENGDDGQKSARYYGGKLIVDALLDQPLTRSLN